ncbi:MAG: hypothetical protein QF840_16145, partial [Pseudomonadales bacterium]|nr:hypothetical protein [Pseudomonadales bacterium]
CASTMGQNPSDVLATVLLADCANIVGEFLSAWGKVLSTNIVLSVGGGTALFACSDQVCGSQYVEMRGHCRLRGSYRTSRRVGSTSILWNSRGSRLATN